jgi:hypothetical protein
MDGGPRKGMIKDYHCYSCHKSVIFHGNQQPKNPDGSRHFCTLKAEIEYEQELVEKTKIDVYRKFQNLRHFDVEIVIRPQSEKKLEQPAF